MRYKNDYAVCLAETRRPGRFEGEPPETVYWFEVAMDGDGDPVMSEDGEVLLGDLFTLTEEDPEWIRDAAGESRYFYLRYSDNGFLYGSWLSDEEAKELVGDSE